MKISRTTNECYLEGFETERLVLRKLTPADLPGWEAFFVDNPMLKFNNYAHYPEKYGGNLAAMSAAWLQKQFDRYDQGEFGYLAIVARDSGKLLGQCGVFLQNVADNRFLSLGIALLPEAWGKGIGKEASGPVIDFIFENGIAEEIHASVNVDHKVSSAFASRLGFEFVKKVKDGKRWVHFGCISASFWAKHRHGSSQNELPPASEKQATVLLPSDLNALYELEQKAAKERPGQYIMKSRKFLQTCLESGFTVGMKSGEQLIGAVMVSVWDGRTGMYASILPGDFPANERIAFREGAYVLKDHRKQGIVRELGRFLRTELEAAGIKALFSAISPQHVHHLDRMTGSENGFVIRRMYNAIANGLPRYLLQYWPDQEFEQTETLRLGASEHEYQQRLFDQGYVGTGLEFVGSAPFILFKMPLQRSWIASLETSMVL